MTARDELDCAAVDELAAAYALGALDADEERALDAHLAGCDQPHDEIRRVIEGAWVLPASLDPVTPSGGLRDRLMATVAATAQEHRPRMVSAETGRQPWWRLAPLPTAFAAVALAAAVGLGAWGVSLNAQLAERDAALRAVASAESAYAASGEAGRGWVIQSGDEALFIADELAALAEGQLYELWLIGADGTAEAVGVLTDTEGVALATLERSIGEAVTFAVTVEAERVEQPRGAPVIVADLTS